eukprot:12033089-Alexandrium_andersonii.AAC.1
MERTVMSDSDLPPYREVFGTGPILLCSRHFSAVARPRLWWLSRSPAWPPGLGWRASSVAG